MDVFHTQKRSEIMSRVRGKDTKPELLVRSHLHRLGLRFVIHDTRLPGKPDISFPSRKTVVFVHGCFWHGHYGCKKAAIPATRPEFWRAKIEGTMARDLRIQQELESLGWCVLVIWQCSITSESLTALAHEIAAFPRVMRSKSTLG